MKKLAQILLAVSLVLALGACGNAAKPEAPGSESAAASSAKQIEKPSVIKLGVVGENNEAWEDVAKRFEAKEGIKLELVRFTEYNQPNEALASGDIDLNAFQHKQFLQNFIAESGKSLTIIGDTYLSPLGIYSKKIKNVSELKKGDRIAVPDDVTNYARALFLLQTAGLIKVDGKPGDPVTVDNITENKLELQITPLVASQTPRAMDDVAASVINNEPAADAGLIPTRDAIFLEPVDDASKPYINIVVSRPEDAENPYFKTLVEKYYQTAETEKVLSESSNGSSIAAWTLSK